MFSAGLGDAGDKLGNMAKGGRERSRNRSICEVISARERKTENQPLRWGGM